MVLSSNHETGEKLLPAVQSLDPQDNQVPKNFQAIWDKILHKCHQKLRITNITVRQFLGEFLGTFILTTFAVGTVAQTVLGGREAMSRGNIITINIGCGLAVTMGIYAAGGASGGLVNPALSLAQALRGALPWRHLPAHWAGQYLGAFCAAAAVYVVYYDTLNYYDGGVRQTYGSNATAGIFATFPQSHVTTFSAFVDQFFATGLLILMVVAIVDPRNMEVPKPLIPIGIGMIVTALLTSFEYNCGAALNPARDLGPRVFTALAGWGIAPFSYRNWNWFWVPIFGTHLGAIFGALVYDLCVGIHLRGTKEVSNEQESKKQRADLERKESNSYNRIAIN